MKNCPVSLAVRGFDIFLGAMGAMGTVPPVYAFIPVNELL